MSEKTFGLLMKVKKTWADACLFDNIPLDSTFVVFSDENPHHAKYDEAMVEYLASAREDEKG